MKFNQIPELMKILKRLAKNWQIPSVTFVAVQKRDPFRVLISTLISLRTKDEVTLEASKRLFSLADSPELMIKLSIESIEKAIYPAGFYHTKAKNIVNISKILIDKFDHKVPDDIDILLTLPGVGRKTANLVLSEGFQKPGICVDTHVHRISNRFGLLKSENPFETEMILREKLPLEFWNDFNTYLVAFGQNLCKPVSPFCSKCEIKEMCQQIGVERSR